MTEIPDTEKLARQTVTAGESIKRFLARRAVHLSVLLGVVTVLARGARWHRILDLLSHFPVQIAVAAMLPLVILIGFGRWKAAILPATVVLFNAALLLPLYIAPPSSPCSGPIIRAVSANVLRSNLQYERFRTYVRSKNPDILLVMEVSEEWLTELKSLHSEYPYRVTRPGRGAFGIALYSRLPINDYEIIDSSAAGVPMIRANLSAGGHSLGFVGAHPLPPMRSVNARLRNEQLHEIAALAAAFQGPTLLMGDLNITSWSPHFRDLLRKSRLNDGRKGFGLQPTWPAHEGIPALMQIPIDHTLVSDHLQVAARRAGPNVGSDHLPVEIEFRIGE